MVGQEGTPRLYSSILVGLQGFASGGRLEPQGSERLNGKLGGTLFAFESLIAVARQTGFGPPWRFPNVDGQLMGGANDPRSGPEVPV